MNPDNYPRIIPVRMGWMGTLVTMLFHHQILDENGERTYVAHWKSLTYVLHVKLQAFITKE